MLSVQEKAEVIFLLGWPGNTIVEGTTGFSRIIYDRVTNLSAPVTAQVRTILTRIRNLDTKLDAATNRMLAKRIGDIELRDGESSLLRNEKRIHLKELSRLLDIDLMRSSGVNVSVCV